MNPHLKYLAAVIAGGSMTVASWAQDTPAAPADSATPAGAKDKNVVTDRGTIEATDAEPIRDTLASATEAAVTKDGLDDLVERFVEADRNRLGKDMPKGDDLKALNDLVTQIRTDWKAKYNQEFDFPKKEEDVFKPDAVKIVEGELGPQTAGARTERTGDESTGEKAKEVVKEGAEKTKDAAENAKAAVTGERKFATAMIPASHGQPAIDVPFGHELTGWRIDIPDSVDAPKLLAALQKHLGEVQSMKSQWPADVNDGYLMVSHHVLLGIFEGTSNVRSGIGAGAAQPAGSTIPPATPTPAAPAQ